MERTPGSGFAGSMRGVDVEATPIAESTKRLAYYVQSLQLEHRELPGALADDFDTLSAETTGQFGETFALMAIVLRGISQGTTPEVSVVSNREFYEHMTPNGLLTLNTARRRVHSPLLGEQDLTDKQTALLTCLMENPAAVAGFEQIIERVWSISSDESARANLRVLLNSLKGKIGPLVHSIRGVGYSLTPTEPRSQSPLSRQNGDVEK